MAALRPLTTADTVRGQYEGYLDVDGVAPDSTTESFVAVRLALDTWRWAGVPILIRAGKTMPVTATEISVRFRPVPFDVFGAGADADQQPACGSGSGRRPRSASRLAGKMPGAGRRGASCRTWCSPSTSGSDMRPYDRLIGAALDGQRVLFARQDTVEAAWRVVDPILGDAVPRAHLPARQLGAQGGRRPAARRRHLARPGRLSRRHPDEHLVTRSRWG